MPLYKYNQIKIVHLTCQKREQTRSIHSIVTMNINVSTGTVITAKPGTKLGIHKLVSKLSRTVNTLNFVLKHKQLRSMHYTEMYCVLF